MSDNYTFGKCEYCNKTTALKNGYCSECNTNIEKGNGIIDFFKNMWKTSVEDTYEK